MYFSFTISVRQGTKIALKKCPKKCPIFSFLFFFQSAKTSNHRVLLNLSKTYFLAIFVHLCVVIVSK